MDCESYVFSVEWHDKQADLQREYNLTVIVPARGPLEASMYDPKGKRQFLKQVPVPDLSLEDLYVGSTVMLCSRRLRIKSYNDERTRQTLEAKRNSFALLTAPKAFSQLGKILETVESAKLTITRLRLVNDGGPKVAIAVLGDNAEEKWEAIDRALPHGCVNKVTDADAKPYFEDKERFQSTAIYDHCTLCVVRPHVVKARSSGAVVAAIMDAGFEVSAAHTLHLKSEEARELLEVYHGVLPYFTDLVDSMSSAPCLALELRLPGGVVERFRELCGPHDVDMARHLRPQSLRARFGVDNAQNGVHATDLEDDAEREVRYMFDLLG